MVFITAGMGGGTGTAAAQCSTIKEEKFLRGGIVTSLLI
jgi:cell division GTPase FtsZ